MCTNSNKFLFPRSSLPEVLVANDGAQMNWTSIIFKFRLKPRVNAVFGGGLSLLVPKILSLAKMVSWILFPAALQLEAWIVLLMPCIDCIHVPVQAPAQLCYHRKCLWNSWRHGITSREPAELLLRGRKLLQYSQAEQMFLAWQCYKWDGVLGQHSYSTLLPLQECKCPAWKVFVLLLQHCQGHLSGVQKDKSPIRNWQLCCVFGTSQLQSSCTDLLSDWD